MPLRQPAGPHEDFNERLSQMQKTMVALQKKEQFAKKALYDSQIKWTHFSSDIVRVCKELIDALETENITQYAIKGDDGNKARRPQRQLHQVKDKILKYDSFLLKNRNELSSKEF